MRYLLKMVSTLTVLLVLLGSLSMTTLAAEKITFSCFRVAYDETLRKLFDGFTRETGIQVETTYYSGDQVQVWAAAGTLPDVLLTPNNTTAAWGQAGILIDHTNLAKNLNRSDYIPGVWEENFWQGKMYTIPLATTGRNLLYRSDNFDEAGLDSSKPSKTFVDVTNVAKRLSRVNNGVVEKLGWSSIDVQSLLAMFYINGADLFNSDLTRATFDTVPAAQTLDWWKDIWTRIAPTGAKLPTGNNYRLFVNGTLGMFWWSTDALIRELRTAGDNVDQNSEFFRIGAPFTGEKRPSTPLFTVKLGITTQSKSPATAWKLIEYLERPDNLAIFAMNDYRVPPRFSALRSAAYVQGTPRILRLEGEMLSKYGSQTMLTVADNVNALLNQQVQRFMKGEIPANQALSEAVRQINLSIDAALKK
jgi:multiple sugar transport system substrate-binding protein